MVHSVSRQSTMLLLLLFILLCTDAAIVSVHLVRSNQDTLIVNRLGQIRGSIQQYTKRELHSLVSSSIEDRIEELFSDTRELIKRKSWSFQNSNTIEALDRLLGEYYILKELIHKYRVDSNSELSDDILTQSEKLWALSNTTVLSAQIFFENMRRSLYYHIAGVLITIIVIAVLLVRIKRVIRDKLEYEAHYDVLTGALNKAAFQMDLEKRIEEARRFQRRLCLLLLDIDKFKSINDTYGHKAGDTVLVQMGALIRENIRTTDTFGRIGGEEFVVLVQESDLDSAYQLAEKLRSLIEQHNFINGRRITVSIGISEYKSDTSPTLLEKADQAMYKAKEMGRNRTVKE